MNTKVQKVLEFFKIKEMLSELVVSSLGEQKVKELQPSTKLEEVIKWQEETDEAVTVFRLKGNIPLQGLHDLHPHIRRAKLGGMLSALELVQVAATLTTGRQMKKFIEDFVENHIEVDRLKFYTDKIIVLQPLEEKIKNAIDTNGVVFDHASENLRTIRIAKRGKEAKVKEKLDAMIRHSNASKMLSDAIITIRNDRFVIPVKQEYKSHYGGIVHDQSASGQTLFIEPQVVVELNNDLHELKLKEQLEIERILMELSDFVAQNHDEIKNSLYALAQLDFIFAKARLAKKMKATKPEMNDTGYVLMKKARHPLIDEKVVVANTIEIGKDYQAIVITGPNTGGKTVTLKTIGLCTLMAQSGLQIPVEDGSIASVFGAVYADIGDEQSIEQSLSTFSSHMVNIVDILKTADENSLVLFDELGAGTDPQEGAALAISILDEVIMRGARVIATTHYPELKAYGYNRPQVVNASVEFDIETLSPTYKLLIGIPGKSNAFEISTRLGLDLKIINNARAHISDDTNKIENMIAALEESKRVAEDTEKEAREQLKIAQKLKKDLEKETIQHYENKEKLEEKAKEEAYAIIEKAKKEADDIIAKLREVHRQNALQIKEHELIEARRRLEEATPQRKRKQLTPVNPTNHVFEVGDEVRVLSFGQKGTLVERVNDKEWIAQMGLLKMKVKQKDLEYIKPQKEKIVKPLATIKGNDYHVSLELDLRGMRYEDAILKVDKYIDDALLANYPRVSIIHGKGTGALRTGVQEYLKNHRSVKRIRFGEAAEGGTGVTIVEFK